MPYPRRLLGRTEEIILDFNPHWSYLIRPIGWSALWLVVLGALVWLLSRVESGAVKGFLVLVVVAAWAVTAGIGFLRWRTTEYVVTTDRLIVRRGVISKEGNEIPLEKINNIAFSQSIFERMVGTGDIIVESAGESGQNRYSDIPRPAIVQNEIYKAMEANQTRMFGGVRAGEAAPPAYDPAAPLPASMPPPEVELPVDAVPVRDSAEPLPFASARSGDPSVPYQIEELGRLRDQGLITEDEFQAKKAELLRRM